MIFPELLLAQHVEHVSFSSLSEFEACPEKWRRRYILGERSPKNAAMILGTADHAAAAWNYAQKISSGNDLPVSDVCDVAAETIDREVAEIDPDTLDSKRDEMVDLAVSLARTYHTEAAHTVQPVAVEEEFYAPVGELALRLRGFIDVVAGDADGEATGLIERKTAERRGLAKNAVFQGRVYQLHRALPVTFHVTVKNKTPVVEVHDDGIAPTGALLTATARAVRARVLAIEAVLTALGPEQPWPDGMMHTWACNRCHYRPSCPHWEE